MFLLQSPCYPAHTDISEAHPGPFCFVLQPCSCTYGISWVMLPPWLSAAHCMAVKAIDGKHRWHIGHRSAHETLGETFPIPEVDHCVALFPLFAWPLRMYLQLCIMYTYIYIYYISIAIWHVYTCIHVYKCVRSFTPKTNMGPNGPHGMSNLWGSKESKAKEIKNV